MSKEREHKVTAVPAKNMDEEEMKDQEEIQVEEKVEAEQDNSEFFLRRITELENENSELKDQFLRKQADFENFRKRMFREKDEAIKFANTTLLLDIIPILDDFDRALKSGEASKDFKTLLEGIEMIEKHFSGLLERKWGLSRFDAAGQDFDPEKHEALHMEETDKTDKPIVVEDYQKGYMLHGRVVRHSKVKVHMPLPNTDRNVVVDSGQSEGQQGEEKIKSENKKKKNDKEEQSVL